MRLMIAAGGTGGHVYPALAAAEHLVERAELYFVGTVGGFERPLVDQAVQDDPSLRFAAYDEVRAGPLHGVNPLRALSSLTQLAAGLGQAFGLLWRVKPSALLLTGGWVGVPVALAAWLLRVPMLIYLPDIEPGLTIKALRSLVRRVAVTTDASAAFVPARQMVVTGYPLRRSVVAAAAQRAQAQAHFQLDPARKTLLVFGGSRGAQTINTALLGIARDLLADGVQILHVTGTLDWERINAAVQKMGSPADYHVHPYLHDDMGLAFAAADLAICRSGASVLGELPLFGLPSVLVPNPFAWRYQKVNADWLAERGAALVMEDARMAADLLPAVRGLLNDSERLAAMGAAARALAVPDGARRLAGQVLKLAGAQ